MKQFQYITSYGIQSELMPESLAKGNYCGDPVELDTLGVGFLRVDRAGIMWTRKDDLVDHAEIGRQRLQHVAQVERLERIATAALQGFLSGSDAGVYPDPTVTAAFSVEMARALIAELDKQA